MSSYLQLINKIEVPAGGASSVQFSSIPQTYTDLMLVASIRNSSTYEHMLIGFNGSTSSFTGIYASGYGSNQRASGSYARYLGNTSRNGYTADTFGATTIFIPNYTGNKNKGVQAQSIGINGSTTNYAVVFSSNLWANTSAITSIELTNEANATILENSTAYLYGIKSS